MKISSIFIQQLMKEISVIIEKLHNINEQIIEKDNMIEHMNIIITIITQLMNDLTFVKSEVYLDLRAKYLLQIEDQLQKLLQLRTTIEPENPTTIKKDKNTVTKHKQLHKESVVAPLMTDIFMAPKCRQIYTHKKVQEKDQKKNDIETNNKYVSFDYKDHLYYIDIVGKNDHYTIYNEHIEIVGDLHESVMTLIHNDDLSQTETINLKTTSQTEKSILFGSYIFDSI